MADINITCPACGNILTVSEFVTPSSITCHKCGTHLQKPDTPIQRVAIRLQGKEDQKKEDDNQTAGEEWRFHRHTRHNEGPGQRPSFSAHHIGAWLLFLAVGSLMGWLRYGHFLLPAQMAMMREYAPFVLLALHVVIILSAFKHSIFDGILGFLIPPYPYYFIFIVSDEFYLRAIVGAALVGIGQDAFIYGSREGVHLYNFITSWIASGG